MPDENATGPMERVSRDELDKATRVPRDEVEEGERYIFEWSPYSWAAENEGYVGRVWVTVTDVSDIVGDIKMEADDGSYLNNLGEKRPQVLGRAENTTGVPDLTDVGLGGRFYELHANGDASGTDREAMRPDTTGPLPGGVADRLS